MTNIRTALFTIAFLQTARFCSGQYESCAKPIVVSDCEDKEITLEQANTCYGWYILRKCMHNGGCPKETIAKFKEAYEADRKISCLTGREFLSADLITCSQASTVSACIQRITDSDFNTCVGWYAARKCLVNGHCSEDVIKKLKARFEEAMLLTCGAPKNITWDVLNFCKDPASVTRCVNGITIGAGKTCQGWYAMRKCMYQGECSEEKISEAQNTYEKAHNLKCDLLELAAWESTAYCKDSLTFSLCMELVTSENCQGMSEAVECATVGQCSYGFVYLMKVLFKQHYNLTCKDYPDIGTWQWETHCVNPNTVTKCVEGITTEFCKSWPNMELCMQNGQCSDTLQSVIKDVHDLVSEFACLSTNVQPTKDPNHSSTVVASTGVMLLAVLSLLGR